jgi:hypothetical protein
MIKRPNWGKQEQSRRAGPDLPSVETLSGAQKRLLHSFLEIGRHHGWKKTRQMFKNYSREPNATEQAYIRKLEWLERLDSMKPRANIKQLARDLLKEKGISRDNPKFQNQFEALERKIRRAKQNRATIEAEFAAVLLPVAHDEPAKYQVVKSKKRDISQT